MSGAAAGGGALRKHLHCTLVGLGGGGAVGLVGWGGAQVIIPGMTAAPMSLSQLSATGISLTSLSLSTTSSAIRFLREDCVSVDTAAVIAVPSVLSARVGTVLARRLSGNVLGLIFNGLSIILIPTHLWIQKRAEARNDERRKQQQRQLQEQQQHGTEGSEETDYVEESTTDARLNRSIPLSNCASVNREAFSFSALASSCGTSQPPSSLSLMARHASYGALCGMISALMGTGGLPFTMSYLTEFTDLNHHLVQGTAVCSVIPSILTSAGSRFRAIPKVPAAIVAASAITGGYLGAQVALSVSDERLRQLYMFSLVVFGSRSMLAASRNIRNIWLKKR